MAFFQLRAAALFAALLVLAACASPAATPTAPAVARPTGAERPKVTVQGLAYRPPTIEVAVGATVVWLNSDPVDHTVTAGTPEKPDVGFDVGLERKTTAMLTFTKAGTFPYFCAIHRGNMRGEVVVK